MVAQDRKNSFSSLAFNVTILLSPLYHLPSCDVMITLQTNIWSSRFRFKFHTGNAIFIYTPNLKRLNHQISCRTYHCFSVMQATMTITLKGSTILKVCAVQRALIKSVLNLLFC